MSIEWQALWQAAQAIGTALGVLVLLGLGLFTLRHALRHELPELKRVRNAQVAIDIYNELRTEKGLESLRKIYRLEDGTVPENMEVEVERVLDRLELLGALVTANVMDKDVALRLVRGQPLRCWYKLRQYIEHQRQRRRGHYARHVEYYAHLSLKHQYENVPPKEWTSLEGVDLVTKLKEELLPPREPPK